MNRRLIAFAALLLLSGCSKPADSPWLGYAEGDYVYVAAPAAGWVTDMTVERGATVKEGEPLFTLDTESQAAGRDQALAAIVAAESQRASAEASLDLATKELKRQTALLKTAATTRQIYDQAKSTYNSALASVRELAATEREARATLANAAYQLSQRRVVAHTSGRVEDIYFRKGEYAGAQTPVISLLPPENVYVRFFIPEREYARARLGEKVRITCDGCKPVVATVTFISSAYEYAPPVVFSVKSRDKLVFKAEARAPGLMLHPGQPVDVRPL